MNTSRYTVALLVIGVLMAIFLLSGRGSASTNAPVIEGAAQSAAYLPEPKCAPDAGPYYRYFKHVVKQYGTRLQCHYYTISTRPTSVPGVAAVLPEFQCAPDAGPYYRYFKHVVKQYGTRLQCHYYTISTRPTSAPVLIQPMRETGDALHPPKSTTEATP